MSEWILGLYVNFMVRLMLYYELKNDIFVMWCFCCFGWKFFGDFICWEVLFFLLGIFLFLVICYFFFLGLRLSYSCSEYYFISGVFFGFLLCYWEVFFGVLFVGCCVGYWGVWIDRWIWDLECIDGNVFGRRFYFYVR